MGPWQMEEVSAGNLEIKGLLRGWQEATRVMALEKGDTKGLS